MPETTSTVHPWFLSPNDSPAAADLRKVLATLRDAAERANDWLETHADAEPFADAEGDRADVVRQVAGAAWACDAAAELLSGLAPSSSREMEEMIAHSQLEDIREGAIAASPEEVARPEATVRRPSGVSAEELKAAVRSYAEAQHGHFRCASVVIDTGTDTPAEVLLVRPGKLS